ncbi:Nephrocystin-3 [Dactylellina cionopaga]|nr:Nephrocystin-3 [Dactylellina cionopaga]
MNPAEGKELVFKIHNQEQDSSSGAIAEQISHELGGLPLALAQGVKHATQRCWKLDELLRNLQYKRAGMLQNQLQSPQHASVFITLDMAISLLERTHVVLLYLISLMRPQSMPSSMLIAGASNLVRPITKENRTIKSIRTFVQAKMKHTPNGNKIYVESACAYIFQDIKDILQSQSKLDDAIFALEKASLLLRCKGGHIWVHDRVQEILRKEMKEHERKTLLQCAEKIAIGALPIATVDTRDTYAYYSLHAMEVITSLNISDVHDPKTVDVLNSIGFYLRIIGRYDEAVKWHKQAIVGFEKLWGTDSSSTLGVFRDLALAVQEQGEYNEAIQWYKRSLAGLEKGFGKDPIDTWRTVWNIAFMFLKQNNYNEALQWYQRAHTGYTQVYGATHSDSLSLMKTIGWLYEKLCDYNKAMEWYRAELNWYESISKTDNNQNKCDTISRVAGTLDLQCRYDEASQWYKRALDGYMTALGADHLSSLTVMNKIGRNSEHQVKYDKAILWFEQTLAGYEKTVGKDHPDAVETAEDLRRVRQKKADLTNEKK